MQVAVQVIIFQAWMSEEEVSGVLIYDSEIKS